MARNGVLLEGALEFLSRLKKEISRCRIYIITNGATINAEGRIRSTGIDRFIDGLFVSESMGVAKPAAEYFDLCLQEIGEPKESCIIIGDSLSADMQGAQNAAICSVWFMPEGNISAAVEKYGIQYVASSYDELFDILKEWSTSSGSA